MVKRASIFLFLIFTLTTIAAAQIRHTVIPDSPRPGDSVTIGINVPIKEALLFVNGRQAAKAAGFFVPADGRQADFTAAILTIPSTAASGNAIIRLNNQSGTLIEIPIIIAEREFRSETIRLTPSLTSLVADPNPQRTVESERLWEILITNGNQVYHYGPFIPPVT